MFQDIVKDAVHKLPPIDHLSESWHQWSQREIDALTLAVAAKRYGAHDRPGPATR